LKNHLPLVILLLICSLVQGQIKSELVSTDRKPIHTKADIVALMKPSNDTTATVPKKLTETNYTYSILNAKEPFSQHAIAFSLLGPNGLGGIEYHRTLAQGENSMFNLCVGAGYLPLGITRSGTVTLSLQALGAHRFKRHPHYLEYGLTGTLGLFLPKPLEEHYQGYVVGGLIGYRYQQPQGFFFRAFFNPSIVGTRGLLTIVPWTGVSFGYSF